MNSINNTDLLYKCMSEECANCAIATIILAQKCVCVAGISWKSANVYT